MSGGRNYGISPDAWPCPFPRRLSRECRKLILRDDVILSTDYGETKMVSGYDKNSPDPKYEPDLGPGGNIFLLALVAFIAVATLGWVFI